MVDTGMIGFCATATITSTAAGTAVSLVANGASVIIPPDYIAFIQSFRLKVNGATAWSGGTLTKLTIEDNAGTPVPLFDIAVAALTGNALLGPYSANVTPKTPWVLNTGATAGAGLQIIGDHNAGAGSSVVVTVFGYYAKQANV